MVRATFVLPALFALASTVYAGGSVVDIDSGEYLGLGVIHLDNFGQSAIDARGADVHNLIQDTDILGSHGGAGGPGGPGGPGGSSHTGASRPNRPSNPSGHQHTPDCGHSSGGGAGGLLGGLLKREVPAEKLNLMKGVRRGDRSRKPANKKKMNKKKMNKKKAVRGRRQ